jgi:hypothetical protein
VPRKAIAAPIMLLAALSLGCVAQGGRFSATAAYGVGYYNPFGSPFSVWGPRYYGVWGPRYRVAPYRAPVRGRVVVRGGTAPHSFRAAPVRRPVPSIPQRPRAPVRRAAYRVDDRSGAGEPVIAPIALDAPAGSRICALVALDARREPELVAFQPTQ